MLQCFLACADFRTMVLKIDNTIKNTIVGGKELKHVARGESSMMFSSSAQPMRFSTARFLSIAPKLFDRKPTALSPGLPPNLPTGASIDESGFEAVDFPLDFMRTTPNQLEGALKLSMAELDPDVSGHRPWRPRRSHAATYTWISERDRQGDSGQYGSLDVGADVFTTPVEDEA